MPPVHDASTGARKGTTLAASIGALVQCRAHAAMSLRRFSNMSPRRYACSTAEPTAWANDNSMVWLVCAVRS